MAFANSLRSQTLAIRRDRSGHLRYNLRCFCDSRVELKIEMMDEILLIFFRLFSSLREPTVILKSWHPYLYRKALANSPYFRHTSDGFTGRI